MDDGHGREDRSSPVAARMRHSGTGEKASSKRSARRARQADSVWGAREAVTRQADGDLVAPREPGRWSQGRGGASPRTSEFGRYVTLAKDAA